MKATEHSVPGSHSYSVPRGSGREGRIRHMRIEPADNGGFSVDTDYHQPEARRSDRPIAPGESVPATRHVFGDAKSLHDHLHHVFPAPPTPKAKAKAQSEGAASGNDGDE